MGRAAANQAAANQAAANQAAAARNTGKSATAGQSARSRAAGDDEVSSSTVESASCDSTHAVELAAYRTALSAMALKLSRAVDDERTRIARGLHDDLGQTLVAAQLRLAELKRGGTEREIRSIIQHVNDLVGEAVSSSRSLTFELMTPLMPELGIENELRHITARIAKRHDFGFRFECDALPKPMGREEAETLLRAVRELLINVGKHARADTASVTIIGRGAKAEVSVRDDGIGFATEQEREPHATGFGLLIIRERLREVGGDMVIDSSPGAGTEVVLTIPLLQEQT